MASPLTAAIATRWIEDGTADTILRFIRAETRARQAMAAEMLPQGFFRSDPLSFNLWMQLPRPWTRSAFVGHMGASGIGVVASDAFTVGGEPTEAVRVCLGGPTTREQVSSALDSIARNVSRCLVTSQADRITCHVARDQCSKSCVRGRRLSPLSSRL